MRLRVLLVEDNADTRYLLCCLLEDAGYDVRTAGSVREALREHADRLADVLISDIGLPDGSGYDLLTQLHAGGASPYGIAMSGFGTESDVAATLAVGFRHHLVKPIDVNVLEQLVRAAGEQLAARAGET